MGDEDEGGTNSLSGILDFEIKAHTNQKRKGTIIPYIVHPIETTISLAQNNASNPKRSASSTQLQILSKHCVDPFGKSLPTEDFLRALISKYRINEK